MPDLPLHPSIVAMVSLAAGIAANHPKKGLCQLERLRGFGISEEQIDMVVDIARHLRDEAGQMQDAAFDDEAKPAHAPVAVSPSAAARRAFLARPPCSAGASSAQTFAAEPAPAACCTPTAKGNSCC